ncbi:hypothetical protein ACOTCG_27900 [Achromobacter xylosoxidans]
MLLPIGRLAVSRRVPGEQYIAALADVALFDVLGCGLLSLCMVSFSLGTALGLRAFLLANMVLVGAAIMSFAVITHGWPLSLQIVQLALFGAANSMQFAAMNSVTLKGLNKRDAGSGNSLFSMIQRLAIGLGVTIGGGLAGLFSGRGNAMLMRAFMLTFASAPSHCCRRWCSGASMAPP